MMKYYRGALLVAILALGAGFYLGGSAGLAIVAILGVLETSLSFDNAVVNASIMKNWDDRWRQRFLIFGWPVAVVGMRLAFPLTVVAIVASIGPFDALSLALNEPKKYETILTSVHHEIAAFGGAFLMMLFLKFFFDQEKSEHWVGAIEKPLRALGRLEAIEILITLSAVLASSVAVAGSEKLAFITTGVAGLMTYVAADGIGALVGGDDDGETTKRIIKQGVMGLIYLEIIDASFSFDGVIAAFALTNNLFVMMVGLGVGAMFVRSMTLHLVDTGKLAEFRYLEHGAFWAIGILASIMFAETYIHVPDVVTGLIGAGAIGMALWSSIKANREDAAAAKIQMDAYYVRNPNAARANTVASL